MNIPDNYDLWEDHEAEQEKGLEKLPVCENCGQPIQSERCYIINDSFICPDCLESDFGHDTDEFTEG